MVQGPTEEEVHRRQAGGGEPALHRVEQGYGHLASMDALGGKDLGVTATAEFCRISLAQGSSGLIRQEGSGTVSAVLVLQNACSIMLVTALRLSVQLLLRRLWKLLNLQVTCSHKQKHKHKLLAEILAHRPQSHN